jgi:ABC-type bacteriocin/lantibiotic exporter with double-glycine peptidase domain
MLLVLILALLFVGLSGENHAAPGIPQLPPGLPRHVFLSKVPQLYQQKAECGPTSLTMVLRYWNVPVSKEEIDDDLGWHEGKCVATGKIPKIAKQFGLKSRKYSGNLEELMKQLAQKRPVIVRQWASETSKRGGTTGQHARVAIGYDYDQQVVFLRDPLPKGPSSLSFEEFLNLWDMTDHKKEKQRSRNLMIVISR